MPDAALTAISLYVNTATPVATPVMCKMTTEDKKYYLDLRQSHSQLFHSLDK